jgi:hypothetical protein
MIIATSDAVTAAPTQKSAVILFPRLNFRRIDYRPFNPDRFYAFFFAGRKAYSDDGRGHQEFYFFHFLVVI